MTTQQEQLKKIIKSSWLNTNARESLLKLNQSIAKLNRINDNQCLLLASAILSAMRIDEVKLEKELLEELRFLKVKEENFNIMPSDIVFQRVAKAIASHAQEIIKFEEE